LAFRGVDIRETGDRIVFRALLQGSTGAVLATGTTNLKLYELQSDASLKSYDFNDNTFKTTALTTENRAMTHRTGNNGATNTGIWTTSLTTLTGFTAGNIYFAAVTNTSASPATQVREFQFGAGSGALDPYDGADAGLTNLSIGGPVASKADVENISGGAVRVRITILPEFGIPDTGSAGYTIEARTFDASGDAIDADSNPTISATGIDSGNLDDHLGVISHPSTGVYRWTYTVQSTDIVEEVRIDVAALMSAVSYDSSAFVQITDVVADVFTATDRSRLDAIYGKLPSKNFLTGTSNSDGDIQMSEATGNFPGSVASTTALGTQAKADVNAEADQALLDIGLTTTRTANLDNLNATVSSREAESTASSRAAANLAAIDALHDFDPTTEVVDGLTYETAIEFLLAVVGGTTTVEGSSVTFNKRNGATAKVTITYGVNQGERTGSTILN
jgi:general stress protein 26